MTFATLSSATMCQRHGNFQPHSHDRQQHRHLGMQMLLTQHTRIIHSSWAENITRFNPCFKILRARYCLPWHFDSGFRAQGRPGARAAEPPREPKSLWAARVPSWVLLSYAWQHAWQFHLLRRSLLRPIIHVIPDDTVLASLNHGLVPMHEISSCARCFRQSPRPTTHA
jgi:hypothetical protein